MAKTEEEIAAEELQRKMGAAGFQEGTPAPAEDTSREMPTPPAPPAEPSAEAPPEKPVLSAEDITKIQEENKTLRDKAEWADRAQKTAERERERADREAAEAQRLRTVLGTPAKTPERALTPEESQQEQIAEGFMRTYLPRALKNPEIIAAIPEDVLAQHPAMKKLAVGLWMTGDELEKSRFVSQFELKERQAVETRIIPALQHARQASGYKKSYGELFEEMKKSYQETAGIFGFTPPVGDKPPSPPPPQAPPGPAPVGIPPSLSGIPGGGGPPAKNTTPVLDLQTARMIAQA